MIIFTVWLLSLKERVPGSHWIGLDVWWWETPTPDGNRTPVIQPVSTLPHWAVPNTRAVYKVRGLTLLLRVGTLWRCGNSLFFEVPPLTSDTLLTTLHPLLENVLQTVDRFEISCLGAPFSWLEKPRNHMGRDLDWILCSAWKKWIVGTPLEHPPYSSDFAPCDFWAFPTMKRELRGKKFRSDQRSAARFREVGGAL
jgi:hypothetical protein